MDEKAKWAGRAEKQKNNKPLNPLSIEYSEDWGFSTSTFNEAYIYHRICDALRFQDRYDTLASIPSFASALIITLTVHHILKSEGNRMPMDK